MNGFSPRGFTFQSPRINDLIFQKVVKRSLFFNHAGCTRTLTSQCIGPPGCVPLLPLLSRLCFSYHCPADAAVVDKASKHGCCCQRTCITSPSSEELFLEYLSQHTGPHAAGGDGDLSAIPSTANGGEQFLSKRGPRSLFSRVQMVETRNGTAGNSRWDVSLLFVIK